jgi:hypothetical protein
MVPKGDQQIFMEWFQKADLGVRGQATQKRANRTQQTKKASAGKGGREGMRKTADAEGFVPVQPFVQLH